MTQKLIVIIPTYNEEATIANVIKNIPQFEHLELNIIVINDGSSDKTKINAEEADAIVISNKKNLGLGRTFRIGVEAALKRGADIIVNIDADGQYDPRYIQPLVNKLISNKADLVIGNRLLDDTALGKNFIQRNGNKFISVFISKILLRKKEILDIQSGFRAFNRQLAQFLLKNLKGKYTYTQEMMIITSLLGYKIEQIGIKFFKRSSGFSRLIKNPFIYLIKILTITFKTLINVKLRKITKNETNKQTFG